MTPVTCLITDRRRLGMGWETSLVERVTAAARAGLHLIQIRERDLDGRDLVHLVERCVDAVRATSARVIVNDRLDVALAARAHGVHLREDSMDPWRVRALVPRGFFIGRSIHSTAQAGHFASAVDYMIFGQVFETGSKPGLKGAGVGALAAAVRASTIPVLAVGGISSANVCEVAETGAAGIAAIGLFSDPVVSDLPEALARVVRLFDTAELVP